MAILILGGRGNLGTQLTKVFSADFETISWDRDDQDVLDFPVLTQRIRELRPQVIINAVAYNSVDKCEDPTVYPLALKLNSDLPAKLAAIAQEIDAVLIHYSSDYVFSGTEQKTIFMESDTPNPVNKYGESKARGETEILCYDGDLKYYLVRTSKLFGPPGTSAQAKPSFFDIMLNLAQDKKEITVVNEELSCFTYTPDLAAATRRLWELEVPFGIYHLVNEGACTWYDGAQELFRLKKIPITLKGVRSENLWRTARRPKFSVLGNVKVKKMRPWRSALEEYLQT